MTVPDPHAALHEHFGFPAFRPGQEEAVRAALAGRDVLVVMPTGAGKSLCYQLPALMRDDLTVVVSPLVSLMQDQVAALERRAPGRVALVSGQQSARENETALVRAVAGEVRLLYVAPERFSSPGFARDFRRARVGLFVVDEAHCVSQWGHDFRPDYFRLADAARWLGASSVIASTATATPSVAADIVTRLGLRTPARVSTGFDRPNLSWAVVPSAPRHKPEQLVALLAPPQARPAIVYAGTRRDADLLARGLGAALGRPVPAYHAGLDRLERTRVQERFMGGEVDVVVATNAFGMGVDKADVRTVAHATVPPSVEAYYQEAGRAGRDGEPARAVLLAAPRDKGLHVFFIQRAEVTEACVAQVALRLEAAAGGPPTPGHDPPVFDVALADLVDAGPSGSEAGGADRVRAVVGMLARAGVVQPAPSPVDRVRGRLVAAFDGRARAACRGLAAGAQRARWAQYRAIWGYVEGSGCRRAAILAHFGDEPAGRAGAAPRAGCCDVCDARVVPAALRPSAPVAAPAGGGPEHLAEAIVRLVATAAPPVGPARVVEVLRGSRSRELRLQRHDGLPAYGTYAHLGAAEVRAAVEALVAAGRLALSEGPFGKLRVVGDERAAAA